MEEEEISFYARTIEHTITNCEYIGLETYCTVVLSVGYPTGGGAGNRARRRGSLYNILTGRGREAERTGGQRRRRHGVPGAVTR